MLYKFSSLDNYQDSIHYRDSFTATIVIVKFLLSLSTMSKAFDCVNHDILLSKLVCYGVLDDSLVWFASYLSCRRQRVRLQGLFSTWGMVCAGVPQGSILGPLLFSIILYMNDLPSVVHGCQLNMHADDMKLHCFNSDLFSTQHGLHSE